MLIKAFRCDVSKLKSPFIDHRGYLRADALLARTGIQEYQMTDGSIRRELRPKEEVLKKDSVKSLLGAVVTNDHPPVPLDSKNTRSYAVGHLDGEPEEIDDCYLKDGMTIYDQSTIDDVMTRGKQQISMGYHCDIEMSPGVDPQFGAYDAIQRNIGHNHAAIVKDGRAGPVVKIKMDSVDGQEVEFATCYRTDEDGDGDGDEGEDGGSDEENSYDEDEEDIEMDAKWTSKYKSSLPKSSFAYVDPEGKGHFPYKNAEGEIDLPHLRNALARAPQSPLKGKVLPKLKAAAKKAGVGSEKKDGEESKKVSKSKLSQEKNTNEGENTMEIILKMDGLDYKFPETQAGVVQAISKKFEEAKVIKADHDAALVKITSLKSDIEKRDSEIAHLKKITTDEKEMAKIVQDRVDLIEVCKKMFADEATKLDSLSTLELQKKIIAKCRHEVDVTKHDEAFIKGLASGLTFGFKTDETKKLEESLGKIKQGSDENKTDSLLKEFHDKQKNAYKPKAA